MKKEIFWKNFNLGTELSVSANFIYNGLKTFDEMDSFYYEDTIFEFLYLISVGLERLEKIAIILIEHNTIDDQDAFEKSLITHNHLELLIRIKKKHDLKLHTIHNSFLQMLGNFYKTIRYNRFNLREVYSYNKEKISLQNFISKNLNIEIEEIPPFQITGNSFKIKKFMGKIIGKIATEIYEVIYTEASKQGIYTYEIRINSKADKIFLRKEFNFFEETILWKELLIFLMNTKERTGIIDLIKSIEPLSFDIELSNEYLGCFQNDLIKLDNLDELESLYDDIEDKKGRFEILEVINNPNIYFDSDLDEDMT